MDQQHPGTRDGQADGAATISAQGLRVAHLGPDEVVVKRGLAELRLTGQGIGETVERVIALADGRCSLDELTGAFPVDTRADVRRLVVSLRARGLLHEGVAEDPAALFWSSLAPGWPDARGRLGRSSALVFGAGKVAGALTGALLGAGVGRVGVAAGLDPSAAVAAGDRSAEAATPAPELVQEPVPTGWDLWCAAADAADERTLMEVAHRALQVGVVFLPVWLDDFVIRVGPLTHPFDTACLRCYLLRVDSNDTWREVHALLRGEDGITGGAGFLPAMSGVAGQVAAMEAVKHLAGLPVTACGRAIELSLVPFRAAARRVLRVPRCPECSGTARQGAPVIMHGSQLSE